MSTMSSFEEDQRKPAGAVLFTGELASGNIQSKAMGLIYWHAYI